MPRGRRRRLALMAAVIVVVWLVACGLTARATFDKSQDGRDALRSAQRDVDLSDLLDGSVVTTLDSAAQAFEDAHAGASSGLWIPLRAAPVIGRQLSSAEALTGAVRDTARQLADIGERARALIDSASPGPAGRLAVAQGMHTLVEEIVTVFGDVDLGPERALLEPFAAAREELEEELAGYERDSKRALSAVATLVDLLEGPTTSLVFAANNAEMRAGSGMLLSAGELRSGAGQMEVSDFVPVEDIAAAASGAVALPDELAALWGWARPDIEIRNLMLSPRFAPAANVGADIWSSTGRPPVDGVFAIDPVALAAILEVTGPVEVGAERYDADTVVEELLEEQYLLFDRSERPERQERSARVAAAVFREVTSGDFDLVEMAEALKEAAAGRHLLAWSRDEQVQAGWEVLGADGDLAPDSVLVALSSRGTGKMDPYLRIDAAMTTEAQEHQTKVGIRICVASRVPDDLPATVTRDNPELGLVAGQYRGMLTVSVPADASSLRFEGDPTLNVSGPDGPSQVIGYQFDLARGTTHEALLTFELPAGRSSVVVEPSARVPTVRWHDGGGQWKDSRPRRRPFVPDPFEQPICQP